jgi:hypothetical protein
MEGIMMETERDEFKELVKKLYHIDDYATQGEHPAFLIGMINSTVLFGCLDEYDKGKVSAFRAAIWNILIFIKHNLEPTALDCIVMHYKNRTYFSRNYTEMFHKALANFNFTWFAGLEDNRPTIVGEALGAILVNIDHILKHHHHTTMIRELEHIIRIVDQGGTYCGKKKG